MWRRKANSLIKDAPQIIQFYREIIRLNRFYASKKPHRITSSVSTGSSGNFWLLLLECFSSISKWITIKENKMDWHNISCLVSFPLGP